MARNWRTARTPIKRHEITDEMLAPIQRIANEAQLHEAVYPSKWYGRDFQGAGCLITAGVYLEDMPIIPEDAASREPLMIVHPDICPGPGICRYKL